MEVLGSTPSLGESDAELDELMQDIPESQFDPVTLSSNCLSPLPELPNTTPPATRTPLPLTPTKRPLAHSSVQPLKRARVDGSRGPGGQENSPKMTIHRKSSQKPLERSYSRISEFSAPQFTPSSFSASHVRPQADSLMNASMGTAFRGKSLASNTTSSGTVSGEPVNKSNVLPLLTFHPAPASTNRLSPLYDNGAPAEKPDEDDLEFERWVLESVDIVE